VSLVYIQTKVDRETHRKLVNKALDKETTIQWVIREIILDYLKNEGGKNND
jgi:hypothetical protein